MTSINFKVYTEHLLGLWLKVNASRRRNDPRKAYKKILKLSIVRLRSKSSRHCREEDSCTAKFPAGGCGVKDQVSQETSSHIQYATLMQLNMATFN